MTVTYMAHPLAGDVIGNLALAKRWVRWIEENHPNIAVIASWITECEIWDDNNPKHRADGLQRNLAVIERCDQLWLVGSRISNGMALERDHAFKKGVRVRDLTTLGLAEPPPLTPA